VLIRSVKFFWQRLTRGWDDSETWCLDAHLAKWLLPRLKRFKEVNCGYPPSLTSDKWDEKIDDIIFAMERVANEELMDTADHKRYDKGIKAFSEYWRDLWW